LRFLFETENVIKVLDGELTRQPADVVILDAYGDLYAGDANRTNQIRQFLNEYRELAQKHDCLILWLHHTGKRTDDQAPSKHHVIGGQGFEGKMRVLIELRRDHYDQDRRHLCIVKGNYLPDELKSESFVLHFDKESLSFSDTGVRIPFEQLAKQKDESDVGQERYNQIEALRQQGLRGKALAERLGWSEAYISQIKKKYGPQKDAELT
jgi:RecA-family ATPase